MLRILMREYPASLVAQSASNLHTRGSQAVTKCRLERQMCPLPVIACSASCRTFAPSEMNFSSFLIRSSAAISWISAIGSEPGDVTISTSFIGGRGLLLISVMNERSDALSSTCKLAPASSRNLRSQNILKMVLSSGNSAQAAYL